MSRYPLLILNGAILTVCAVFIYPGRTSVLTALLLLLPFLDRAWHTPVITPPKNQTSVLLFLLAFYGLTIAANPQHLYQAIAILFLVALPEEWFFRAYFMQRLQSVFAGLKYQSVRSNWYANVATSMFFAMTHIPTQGLFGLTVFFPSLLFGWLYQTQKNLILVITLHAISNLLFLLYFRDAIEQGLLNYIP